MIMHRMYVYQHKFLVLTKSSFLFKIAQNFDMVAADVTIKWNRSRTVDFTLAYSESGVSMLVPAKVDDGKNIWIFMRPLETKLWITIGALFMYTGVVVWVIEHRVNKEFRGPPHQQIGLVFWFSFSTLFFAQSKFLFNQALNAPSQTTKTPSL